MKEEWINQNINIHHNPLNIRTHLTRETKNHEVKLMFSLFHLLVPFRDPDEVELPVQEFPVESIDVSMPFIVCNPLTGSG